MANQTCQIINKCDCSPGVFRTNFSAEQPDPAEFFAIEFEQFVPHLGDPDTFWTNIAQPGICTAPTLQEAQDCARRNGNDAIVENWRDPHRNPVVLFGNAAQSCSIPCPTGPAYIYTVEAGTFTARTQEEADALAASYCFSRGLKARQCNPVVPVVPPSIEVVDLVQLWDLSDGGNLVGDTNAGEAGWFNNGGITLPGGATSGSARAVNAFGDVAGLWTPGANQDGFWYDGIIRDIPPISLIQGEMLGMSSDGFSTLEDDGAGGIKTTYLYNPITTALTNLGFFGLGDLTRPGVADFLGPGTLANITQRKVVNSSHQVAGIARVAPGPDSRRSAFRWSGALVDITPAAAFPNQQAGSICIDDTGAVMGLFVNKATTFTRTFLNLSGGPANSNDIGGVGIRNVNGCSMSNKNQIICGVCDDGTPNDRAFYWNAVDGFQPIDRIAGATQLMGDCNSHNDVVGYDSNNVGWIWRGGTVYKLIDILNAWATDPLWTSIQTAELCNDDRQIAGFGIHSGVSKAYLLTLPAGTETGPPPP